MKKLLQLLSITAFVLLLLACGKEAPPEPAVESADAGKEEAPVDSPVDRKIILEINGKKISNKDFKKFLDTQYPGIADSDEEMTTRLVSRIFDSFVEHSMLLYLAGQEQIPVGANESDEYLDELKIPRKELNQAALADSVMVQKFLYFKVYNRIEVSDEEIRRYYNEHMDEFRKKPEVLLYQILVKDKDEAVKIRGALKNSPGKFEEIAKEQSISLEASKGGFMGYFEEGTLPKDMEEVVFSLRPNTISPVVESSYGFHIFKITEKKKGRLLFLKVVSPEIKNKLLSGKLRKAYRDFLEQAKQDLNIDIKYNELYFAYQPINMKGDETYEAIENKEAIDPDPGAAGDSSLQ
jgi:hypothetical protein